MERQMAGKCTLDSSPPSEKLFDHPQWVYINSSTAIAYRAFFQQFRLERHDLGSIFRVKATDDIIRYQSYLSPKAQG